MSYSPKYPLVKRKNAHESSSIFITIDLLFSTAPVAFPNGNDLSLCVDFYYIDLSDISGLNI